MTGGAASELGGELIDVTLRNGECLRIVPELFVFLQKQQGQSQLLHYLPRRQPQPHSVSC